MPSLCNLSKQLHTLGCSFSCWNFIKREYLEMHFKSIHVCKQNCLNLLWLPFPVGFVGFRMPKRKKEERKKCIYLLTILCVLIIPTTPKQWQNMSCNCFRTVSDPKNNVMKVNSPSWILAGSGKIWNKPTS